MNMLKLVEDTKQSLIQDLILSTSGILAGAAIGDPTGIAAAAATRIGSEVMTRIILPLTSRSESKRLYQWGIQAAEGIAQRSKNEDFRKDGVFEDTPTNRSNWEEVIESTLKNVMETTDEPKVKFMAYLTENFHFNEDLDIGTYRQLLNDLDELTYRQLCIISLIMLYGDQKAHFHFIQNIDQVPQNKRTRFHSICREYKNLMDNDYILGSSIPTLNDNPFVDNLGSRGLTDYTKRLYQFVNLNEIPAEDIEEYLSIWKVKVHRSEE